jgi:hypothetical protein
MARVEIPAPGDLIMDTSGNVRVGVAVSLKLAGTGTDATHYSALTGGTSTTGGLVSGVNGDVVDGSGTRRYVDSGVAMDMTVSGRLKQLEPLSASVERNSTGWINVTKSPYTALGDGSTNNATTIQAAIDALPTPGGVIYFPAGDYVVNGTLTIPVGKRVKLLGDGIGATGNFYISRLKRTSGTATMIAAQGTALAAATRVYLEIQDMEISGGALGGKIIVVDRASAMKWTRVRVARSTTTGVQLKGIFDSSITACIFETMGNGTAEPAVIFDSMTGGDDAAAGGAQRVFISDTFWAGNTGTDLKLTGSVADASPANDVELTNCGFEGGSGAQPYIDLAYAQHFHGANVKVSQGSSRTGTLIVQDTSSAGTRSNKFTNLSLDIASGSASYLVEHGQGAMQINGVNCTGSAPGTAHFRVKSTTSAGRFQISGLYTGNPATNRVLDERTIDERIGVGRITWDRVSGAATNTTLGGNQAWSFADAASNDAIMRQEVVPSDCVQGATITWVVWWAITSGSGVGRWQIGSQASFAPGATVNSAATAYTVDSTAAAVNILKRETVAGPTVNPGEVLQATLTRLGAHANDTLAVAALLVGFEATYQAVI